jgi:hypothetical protein
LRWREQGGEGALLGSTTLHHSNDLFFRERLPWRLGLVHLDAGPTLMVHLHGEVGEAPSACAWAPGSTARARPFSLVFRMKGVPTWPTTRCCAR